MCFAVFVGVLFWAADVVVFLLLQLEGLFGEERVERSVPVSAGFSCEDHGTAGFGPLAVSDVSLAALLLGL